MRFDPAGGAVVRVEDYAFLAHLLESDLLAVGNGIDPVQMDAYWSGDIGVPAPIDADVATYLLRADSDALIRAALWAVRNHCLSATHPALHMRVVRWLFARNRLARSELPGLLALMSRQGLGHDGEAIALIAMDAVEEGRLDEGEELIVPLLWCLGASSARLFVDFNNRDADGHLRLDLCGTQNDVAAQSLVLQDGLIATGYDGDLTAAIIVIGPGSEGVWRARIVDGPWEELRTLNV